MFEWPSRGAVFGKIYDLYKNKKVEKLPGFEGQTMKIITILFRSLRGAKVIQAISLTIILILVSSYAVFQQSLLLQADLNIYTNVTTLGWYLLLERLMKALNDLVVAQYILLPVEMYAIGLITRLITERSPASLIIMKENAYQLTQNALRAVLSLIENGLGIINPIVILISRCTAISMRLDAVHMIVVVSCVATVFLGGVMILRYDHQVKESLSMKETRCSENSRSLMNSVSTLVINGMANLLPTWMITLRKQEAVPKARHEVVMALLYGVLEIATYIIPVALVWVLKGVDEFLPLYAVIPPMFWNAWWLFWTTKSLIVSTAPWAQFAAFLANTEPPPTDPMVPTCPADMMPIFLQEDIKEVKLCGVSGCGKSTLMKQVISGICSKWQLGNIRYIDQFASLPLEMTLFEYFSAAFPDPNTLPTTFETELYMYAAMLGIDDIVKSTKLNQQFDDPSGGERKRIIFLHYVLPILMGESSVGIMLLDEVSAGLDPLTFSKVRALLQKVKEKGVRVVSIDHHDYHTDLSVEVFKKVVPAHKPETAKTMPSLVRRLMMKLFPFRYHEEKGPDLESGEVPTDIRVWAPKLGIDEPQLPV